MDAKQMTKPQMLDINLVEPNTGQVPGLPKNPRQWTKAEIQNLKRSISETPELFMARGLLVYPYNGKYVVLGGNMRLEASKLLKLEQVPCIIFDASTPVEKLAEIVIKDNGSFGSWDYDQLANEWDSNPLTEWGVPAWETEQEVKEEEERKEVKEDDFDEEKEGILVRCKPGDIWQLGDHRLMCGDSTDLETVKTLMGGRKLTFFLLILRMAWTILAGLRMP